jgi:hypothetical protein
VSAAQTRGLLTELHSGAQTLHGLPVSARMPD